jgi:hypothetical protein
VQRQLIRGLATAAHQKERAQQNGLPPQPLGRERGSTVTRRGWAGHWKKNLVEGEVASYSE